MKKELTELSDQELLEKRKNIKSTRVMSAVIIGVVAGIAVYSAVKNGLGLLTLFPLLFIFITVQQERTNRRALEKEINARNLN